MKKNLLIPFCFSPFDHAPFDLAQGRPRKKAAEENKNSEISLCALCPLGALCVKK